MNPSMDTVGLYEPSKAGAINPRKLTSAQLHLAVSSGAKLIRDIATKVDKLPSGGFKIHLRDNGSITGGKVILCVGSFLFHNQLLPNGFSMEVYPRLVRVARIPVDEQLLHSFTGMPSVSLMTTRDRNANLSNEKFYLMAPIQYPNGKFYLKIGLHSDLKNVACSKEVTNWHINGSLEIAKTDYKSTIFAVAKNFLPDLINTNEDDIMLDTCSIMETPNQRMYMDQIEDNLYIATGCNGYAAKSSDEIGRLMATLALTDRWDCPFSAEQFRCIKKSKPQFERSRL